jgi:hypothetical protein
MIHSIAWRYDWRPIYFIFFLWISLSACQQSAKNQREPQSLRTPTDITAGFDRLKADASKIGAWTIKEKKSEFAGEVRVNSLPFELTNRAYGIRCLTAANGAEINVTIALFDPKFEDPIFQEVVTFKAADDLAPALQKFSDEEIEKMTVLPDAEARGRAEKFSHYMQAGLRLAIASSLLDHREDWKRNAELVKLVDQTIQHISPARQP